MNMCNERNTNKKENINQNENIEKLNGKQISNKKVKLILNIFFVVVWMIVVFLFSNQNSSNSTNTSTATIKAILKVFNLNNDIVNNTDYIIENLQNITRKSAHFILYTVGGFLIYNLIYFLKRNIVIYCKNKKIEKVIKKYNIVIAILFGFLYAISDEIHQFFIPGRSCEIRDICIDTSGVILGVCLYSIIIKVKK